jgi:glycosyltransferase involved in cell wall biosynthesis
MDELSLFAGAPPDLCRREAELLRRADLVLTGGQSLYEAKRGLHPNAHAVPSSVDSAHFARARLRCAEPDDQAGIARPRIGYAGVIDERMDLELIAAVAAARPAWQLVLLGPVAKIDAVTLPRAANIHYLGLQPYAELPAYMAGWDVGMLPFARNDATRFISPTKTPEYLAAGLPVVSTSIRDVVTPYGRRGLAHIADAPGDFVQAIEAALATNLERHRAAADAFLASTSWDETALRIEALLDRTRRAAFTRTKLAEGVRSGATTEDGMVDV